MDGIVDDTEEEVHVALTVGAKLMFHARYPLPADLHASFRNPFILVLKIGMTQRGGAFTKVSELPGASYTRLLQDGCVGYAVHSGDDSYGRITKWDCNKSFVLKPDLNISSLLSPTDSHIRSNPHAGGNVRSLLRSVGHS